MAYKFDFSIFNTLNPPLTESDQISEAILSVFCRGGSQGSEYTFMYRITKEWLVSEASWMERNKGERWNPNAPNDSVEYQGGVFTTTDSAVTGYAPTMSWESYTITEICREFLNGAPNYGIIMVNDFQPGHAERFYYSSECTIDSLRPKLQIKYNTIGIVLNHSGKKKTNVITIFNTQDVLRLYLQIPGEYNGTIFSLKGKKLYSFNVTVAKWKDIPKNKLEKGVNILRLTNKDLTIVQNIFNY